jgi:hypothetical protein
LAPDKSVSADSPDFTTSTYTSSFATRSEQANSTVPIPSFKTMSDDVTEHDLTWRDNDVRSKVNDTFGRHLLETSKPDYSERRLVQTDRPSTRVRSGPVKYVSSVRNTDKLSSHHILGFAGHVPRAKETTIAYEMHKQPTTRRNTMEVLHKSATSRYV